jgi:hypothetical protein
MKLVRWVSKESLFRQEFELTEEDAKLLANIEDSDDYQEAVEKVWNDLEDKYFSAMEEHFLESDTVVQEFEVWGL